MNTEKPTQLYRYHNDHDVVRMRTFHVIKHTPMGAWISDYGTRRFVLLGAKKRYACPTKEEAQTSFLRRKERQLGILQHQVKMVEHAMKNMRAGRLNERSLFVEFESDY